MTDKKILEGNKLIAEFMGDTFHTDIEIGSDIVDKAWLRNLDQEYYNDLFYHKSWDWLMPVVEKIESLGVSTDIHYFAAPKKNSSGYYSTEFLGYTQMLSSFDSTNMYQNKLESVYHMVIHFIKWYNDNK